jgi:hypothetical protein
VHALGCDQKPIATIVLSEPINPYRALLDPGDYEIDFSLEFAAPAKDGDFAGALGLKVNDTAPHKIVDAPGDVLGCVGSDPVLRETA